MKTLYRPDLLYANGRFIAGGELLVGDDGLILDSTQDVDFSSLGVVELPGKALMPGFVNAHSHSFQRLIRGKSESQVCEWERFLVVARNDVSRCQPA